MLGELVKVWLFTLLIWPKNHFLSLFFFTNLYTQLGAQTHNPQDQEIHALPTKPARHQRTILIRKASLQKSDCTWGTNSEAQVNLERRLCGDVAIMLLQPTLLCSTPHWKDFLCFLRHYKEAFLHSHLYSRPSPRSGPQSLGQVQTLKFLFWVS